VEIALWGIVFPHSLKQVPKKRFYMPELRQDPATKQWVIFARERAKRPHDFITQKATLPLPTYKAECPFCTGNERMTPPEIMAYRKEFARVLKMTLLKMHKGLNNPDFNYIIQTTPIKDEHEDYSYWHLQILPRLATPMGLSWERECLSIPLFQRRPPLS
jgi:galactose-1-phosphate uridylyltransferase